MKIVTIQVDMQTGSLLDLPIEIRRLVTYHGGYKLVLVDKELLTDESMRLLGQHFSAKTINIMLGDGPVYVKLSIVPIYAEGRVGRPTECDWLAHAEEVVNRHDAEWYCHSVNTYIGRIPPVPRIGFLHGDCQFCVMRKGIVVTCAAIEYRFGKYLQVFIKSSILVSRTKLRRIYPTRSELLLPPKVPPRASSVDLFTGLMEAYLYVFLYSDAFRLCGVVSNVWVMSWQEDGFPSVSQYRYKYIIYKMQSPRPSWQRLTGVPSS